MEKHGMNATVSVGKDTVYISPHIQNSNRREKGVSLSSLCAVVEALRAFVHPLIQGGTVGVHCGSCQKVLLNEPRQRQHLFVRDDS